MKCSNCPIFKNPLYSLASRFLLLFFTVAISSFSNVSAQKTVLVKYIDSDDFTIDGVLDEAMWQQAEMSSDFQEFFPTDTKKAEYQTEIRMLYNEKFLYVAIKCYSPNDTYLTPSFERDYDIDGFDYVDLMFDTYSDRTNAFLYGINPFGVVREGLISNRINLDLSWDVKWVGDSKIYDGYYTSEVRIPMSAFKFKENEKRWRFNCFRGATQGNIKSTWSKIPLNQSQYNVGYFNEMEFERNLGASSTPISIIPYLSPSNFTDNINETNSFGFKVGVDAKIPMSTSYMLDLTANPDFSDADVAAGENNTTQFELHRAETRQFFIDNGDLFNKLGYEKETTPFYSRRVGTGKDTSGADIFIPIAAGAKFTGKISNKLRVGLLDVQTIAEPDQLISGDNNLIFAIQQKIFAKSNITGFYINRQVTNPADTFAGTEYNRVMGTDIHIFSKDNTFEGHGFLHKSMTPGISSNAISTGLTLDLDRRKYTLRFIGQYIDKGYQSDLGFTKRKDIIRSEPYLEYKIYPEGWGYVNNIRLVGKNNSYYKVSDNMRNMEYAYTFEAKLNFSNGGLFSVKPGFKHTYLDKEFSPLSLAAQRAFPSDTDVGLYGSTETNDYYILNSLGEEPLPIGDYYYNDVSLYFNTDKRKPFSLTSSAFLGGYYSGEKYTVKTTLTYRVQPIFNASFQIQYDDIRFPDPHPSGTLWYLGPTLNFTFTKSIFWNTDIQYSNQSETFYLVSRFQWRYAPLSDFFITYSDSYNINPISSIGRGIYFKVLYWFDIRRKK